MFVFVVDYGIYLYYIYICVIYSCVILYIYIYIYIYIYLGCISCLLRWKSKNKKMNFFTSLPSVMTGNLGHRFLALSSAS
jgi:hypothetical protein